MKPRVEREELRTVARRRIEKLAPRRGRLALACGWRRTLRLLLDVPEVPVLSSSDIHSEPVGHEAPELLALCTSRAAGPNDGGGGQEPGASGGSG